MEPQQTEQLEAIQRIAPPENRISLGEEDNLIFSVDFRANGEEPKVHSFDALEAAAKMYAMGYKRAGEDQTEMVRIFKEAIGLPGLTYSHAILVLKAFENYLERMAKKPQWQPILGLSTEPTPPRCSDTNPESSLSAYTSTPTGSEPSSPSE